MALAAVESTISNILTTAAKRKAAYIHLTVGTYPILRIDDELVEIRDETVVSQDFMEEFTAKVLTEQQKKLLLSDKEVTCLKDLAGKFRFKVSIFYQKNLLSATLKLIPTRIPSLSSLGLPQVVTELIKKRSGLIVIGGSYGSGRTTTVAAMLEEINKTRQESIVTIEQPIEYIFANQKSLIEQREVGRDVNSFAEALEYLQEADVDVVAVDVNREAGVTPLVVEFANAGRLAFLQMDTITAVQTIEAVISDFEREEREHAQLLLAKSLIATVCQVLVPRVGGGVVPATEILIANDAVRTLIREGRAKQITTVLQSSRDEGMTTLDQSLADLVKSNTILIDRAVESAIDPDALRTVVKR